MGADPLSQASKLEDSPRDPGPRTKIEGGDLRLVHFGRSSLHETAFDYFLFFFLDFFSIKLTVGLKQSFKETNRRLITFGRFN